jgi:hypothetical protein
MIILINKFKLITATCKGAKRKKKVMMMDDDDNKKEGN